MAGVRFSIQVFDLGASADGAWANSCAAALPQILSTHEMLPASVQRSTFTSGTTAEEREGTLKRGPCEYPQALNTFDLEASEECL